MEEKELSPIDKILSEDNDDNIILYDESDNETEFEQVAVIPLDEEVYVILAPVTQIEGVGEDEAFVFIIEGDEGEELLSIVTEDEIVDRVFEEYYKLLDENGEE